MTEATHVLQIAHGHGKNNEFWVTEAQAAQFVVQLTQPQSPFVRFIDTEHYMRGYQLADIHYFEIRPLGADQKRDEGNVVYLADRLKGKE